MYSHLSKINIQEEIEAKINIKITAFTTKLAFRKSSITDNSIFVRVVFSSPYVNTQAVKRV